MFEHVCVQAVKRAQKKNVMTSLSPAEGHSTAEHTASQPKVRSLLFFTLTTQIAFHNVLHAFINWPVYVV